MDFSKYENKVEYSRQNRTAWRDENNRLTELFKNDLFQEFGVQNNPKREKAWLIAWDKGHAMGFSEVYSEFSDLVELIQ